MHGRLILKIESEVLDEIPLRPSALAESGGTRYGSSAQRRRGGVRFSRSLLYARTIALRNSRPLTDCSCHLRPGAYHQEAGLHGH